MKPKLLERLKTPSFMILDEKVYNNKYKGYEASLGLSTGDLIAIKNSTSSIASIAVHELTHHAENNGNLLPQAQTERIQELFPDPIIIGYFEDLYTQDLESYIKEKNADDHFKESIIPKLNYYYCYVVHSLDFDTACYETNYLKKNKIKGEIIPNLDTEFTNYTELTARIMQVRFKENFDPKEILSLEKIKSILKEEDPNLFGELVMEYSGIYQSELYEPLNVLKNISTFSVAGDHNCNSTNPTRELLKENKIVCYFGVKSSGEFVSRQYIFKSEDEAILSIKDAIARKILNLFNNSM